MSIEKYENTRALESEELSNRALEGLRKMDINVPERHTVILPGIATSIENSLYLLTKEIEMHNAIGLYTGINICPYICRFCRYENQSASSEERLEQKIEQEIQNLQKEQFLLQQALGESSKNTPVRSWYIGGGTPALMTEQQFELFFTSLRPYWNLQRNSEITMEITPEIVTPSKLACMHSHGINRISMGIQLLDDIWLKSQNRRHTVSHALDALRLFNEMKIRYNVDLMYGFEGQTVERFLKDIETLLPFFPPEITLYRIENQKRTNDEHISLSKSDSLHIYTMQQQGRMLLLENEYEEKPDGWFRKKGLLIPQVYADRWKDQIPLIGLGAAAYSYSRLQQHTNRSLHNYNQFIAHGKLAVHPEMTYYYNEKQQEIRKMVFSLKSEFKTLFSSQFETFFQNLQLSGLGKIQRNECYLTQEGIIVVEEIMRYLYEQMKE